MKYCNECEETKPVAMFNAKNSAIDKLQTKCRDCQKTIYHANKEKNKAKRAAHWANYYKKNKEAISVKTAIWTLENSSRVKRVAKEWNDNNRGLKNASAAASRARIMNRLPKWSCLEKCKEIYLQCEEINVAARLAGCTEKFVTDHYIPLVGKDVSGLHHENNLVIITLQENLDKSNKFTLDMIETTSSLLEWLIENE